MNKIQIIKPHSADGWVTSTSHAFRTSKTGIVRSPISCTPVTVAEAEMLSNQHEIELETEYVVTAEIAIKFWATDEEKLDKEEWARNTLIRYLKQL